MRWRRGGLGGLGLADASYYIENGQPTKSYCIAYSTGNYTQYPVINHNGKEYEKECVCVCIYIYVQHFVVQYKLMEHRFTIYLNKVNF